MYQMLQTGEWQIADTCPKLIEAIPTRLHDEKRPGDVLKVPGDPLDDVADDARYGIQTFINAQDGRKPVAVAVAERFETILKNKEPGPQLDNAMTMLMIRRKKIEEDARKESREDPKRVR
jgi:hypothetical protein